MKTTDLLILSSLLLASCGGGSSDGYPSLDPNIPPVIGGSWYQPAVMATWHWQLTGTIVIPPKYDTVNIYDIDLFEASSQTIDDLQAVGISVICYFSAGSYEKGRPDADQFKPADLGNTLDGWPDERWLDIRSPYVMEIMLARLDMAEDKGCDGVEPDNMDGYQNDPGFDFTVRDQLAYNRLIANAAHNRNLAVALKNDLDQVTRLVDYYDFAVNEECFFYDECDALTPFITAGKPVLQAEYDSSYKTADTTVRDAMCVDSVNRKFSTLILPLDLDDSDRDSCL